MKLNQIGIVLFSIALLVAKGLIVVLNVIELNDFYGSGPPHFSRMTNMDKWTNSLPVLGVIDGVTILLAASYLYVSKTALMKKPRTNRGFFK